MRIASAIILLAVFVVIAARLTPPYFQNRDLKAYIEEVTESQEGATLPIEMLRTRVISRARQLGLPVGGDQVRITRGGAGLSIEIRYAVPVDIYISTVDLHFHPRAGAR
jgi:hypothetical protein